MKTFQYIGVLSVFMFTLVGCVPTTLTQKNTNTDKSNSMQKQEVPKQKKDEKKENEMMDDDDKNVNSLTEDKDDMIKEEKSDTMIKEEESMLKFSGTVLAGSSSPVIDFNQSDYEAALKSDKVVLLYFYANWCPLCKAEVPFLYEAFKGLVGDDIVAFRVNFNDNETDSYEQGLAQEFGVAYQHTKVILKDKKRILKSPETWDRARYESEITNALK